MAEHRVPLLGGALRGRRSDPEKSSDPQVKAVLAALHDYPVATPNPQFRAELRAQLVAITGRVVAEGEPNLGTSVALSDPRTQPATTTLPESAAVPTGSPRTARAGGRARHGERRGARHGDGVTAGRSPVAALARPLRVGAATLVVLALALTGLVWLSRGSLPGDTLYSLKRASEDVQLATASGDRAKAADYLQFADTRSAEIKRLLDHAPVSASGHLAVAAGAVDARTTRLVTETLGVADSEVRSAAKLLGRAAVTSRSASPLALMTSWSPQQARRLDAIAARLSGDTTQALRQRVLQSARLVDQAADRATALAATAPCASTSGTDKLGPAPGAACAAPTNPGISSTSPSSSRDHATGGSSSGTGKGSDGSSGTGIGGSSNPGSSRVTPPVLPVLPTLSLTHPPKAPVSRGSCGLSASLGGVGVGVGVCTPGVHVSTPGHR